MSVVIGVLVDVSGSMQTSIGDPVNQEGGSWARSIFRVVDKLVKHNVPSGNKVFAIGYGAKGQPDVFDLLNTVKNANNYQGKITINISSRNTSSAFYYFFPEYARLPIQTYIRNLKTNPMSKMEMIEEIQTILERNGAPYIRRWASVNTLLETISNEETELFFTMITENEIFRKQFVDQCLPDECKYESLKSVVILGSRFTDLATNNTLGVNNRVRTASIECIRKCVDKGMLLAWEIHAVEVGPESIIGVKEASNILHGCIEENEEEDEGTLTTEQVDKLMKTVDPFIYGCTPMITALRKAGDLLGRPELNNLQKVLFVLSDGLPTDEDSLPVLDDVNVVSCYITHNSISDPKHLYSTECRNWDKGAKFMFQLSSFIRTQNLPRTIFVRRGWKVDVTNNATKLFLQVNHPDLLDEVCSFARDVVCSQDALSDILASVNLNLYINDANDGFDAKKQEGGTCYANASAAVMHLAMRRIIGREGGYPDFFALRQELIDAYGIYGAKTLQVLQEVCPRYRLNCKQIGVQEALTAVANKRPVIARFRLTNQEWNSFSRFYSQNPTGILTDKVLDIQTRPDNAKLSGHDVVLTSFNSKCLNLMNSWGTAWGNNGFFSVKNANILGLNFVDVYWTQQDLLKSEIEYFDREGPKIAENLFKSLKGLNIATFRCPLCNQESLVSEFSGKLVNAKCPKCHGVFDTISKNANDLVLNMYLTSLCHKREETGAAAAE